MFWLQLSIVGSHSGNGKYSPRGSSGAGHGGTGGRGLENIFIGAFYGSVFHPSSFGSVGGGGLSPGGGVIKITTTALYLDGNIECKGGLDEKENYGGGSGGSIYINTTFFTGEGVIDASGGPGHDFGGGGSGGRIAVYYHSSSFTGRISAYGGNSSHEAGAAGTIYQHNYDKNLRYLWVSNNNRKPLTTVIDFANLPTDNARTWLPSLINNNYHFDELVLSDGSHLVLESSLNFQTVTVGKLRGFTNKDINSEITGYLHVGTQQNVEIRKSDDILPVHVHVYEGGNLGLPSNIEIKKTTFICDGQLKGIKKLTVSDTTMNFGMNSGSIIRGIVSPRRFVFERVTVKAKGKIIFKNVEFGNVLETNEVLIMAKGLIQARNLTVKSDVMVLNETGKFTVDGQGFDQRVASLEGKNIYFLSLTSD